MEIAIWMSAVLMAGIIIVIHGVINNAKFTIVIGSFILASGWLLAMYDIKNYIDQATGRG